MWAQSLLFTKEKKKKDKMFIAFLILGACHISLAVTTLILLLFFDLNENYSNCMFGIGFSMYIAEYILGLIVIAKS